MGSIALVAFAAFMWLFLAFRPVWTIFAAATLAWLAISIAIWKMHRYIRSHFR